MPPPAPPAVQEVDPEGERLHACEEALKKEHDTRAAHFRELEEQEPTPADVHPRAPGPSNAFQQAPRPGSTSPGPVRCAPCIPNLAHPSTNVPGPPTKPARPPHAPAPAMTPRMHRGPPQRVPTPWDAPHPFSMRCRCPRHFPHVTHTLHPLSMCRSPLRRVPTCSDTCCNPYGEPLQSNRAPQPSHPPWTCPTPFRAPQPLSRHPGHFRHATAHTRRVSPLSDI